VIVTNGRRLELRAVRATRYLEPLREGGSVPAVVEADDDGIYVLKFRGAAQGARALIAELLAGEIGRALGLPVPEIVFMELDPALARSEPNTEIQELIVASAGLNLALDYLPGSYGFDALDARSFPTDLASAIVWFDAYVTNVDRTPRNPNILLWHRRPWLIDHGAALFFHHSWHGHRERMASPFPQIRNHVLLPRAASLEDADSRLRAALDESTLGALVNALPEEWLETTRAVYPSPAEQREVYLEYLLGRLAASSAFVEEAMRARAELL
jgi:hypothetical protein